jgi:hypothetical protein
MEDLTGTRPRQPIQFRHDGAGDPAVVGLTELISSEFRRAVRTEPELVAQADGGRVWLLWFAIGATDAVCDLVGREVEAQRDAVFREVVSTIFDGQGVRSGVDPVQADRRLIELFESAGSEAVAACVRNDRKLGYYLEALRVSRRRDL